MDRGILFQYILFTGKLEGSNIENKKLWLQETLLSFIHIE